MDEATEEIYKQVNENWRFLARWRQLAFAGYLTAVYGGLSLINLAIDHGYPRWVIGICFLLLSGVAYIFWIFDERTHRLTMHACEAAVTLEETAGQKGFFRVNKDLDAENGVLHSGHRGLWMDGHSMAANLLFRGSSIIFAITGMVTLVKFICLGMSKA